MISLDLDTQLSGHAFSFLLVFCRIGSALMIFPGIGESFVSPKLRLMFALTVSFLMFPVLMPALPAIPQGIPEIAMLVIREILIGLFFSSLLRLLVGTVEITGSIIAVQTGLSNAMILNPTLSVQSALPSAILGIIAITLIFTTGLDHLLLRAMFDTYELFPVKEELIMGDVAQTYIKLMSSSFRIGIELAAPFLLIQLMLNVALGFMQRMMPQVQLFLVMMPVQLWVGITLFMVTISAMLTVWLRYFNESLGIMIAR